jgi:alpha-tubulin suppressor-like RCC1 family protein
MAVTSAGKLFAWGWNRFGQLGLGHSHDVQLPTQVLGLETERVSQVRHRPWLVIAFSTLSSLSWAPSTVFPRQRNPSCGMRHALCTV